MNWAAGALVLGLFVSSTASASEAGHAEPLRLLHVQNPVLSKLYSRYAGYSEAFSTYAIRQGFSNPIERLATVVHEIIHVASAAHQGYYIKGVYYEPYVMPAHWPSLLNKDIMPYMFGDERSLIYNAYMSATPNNNLGNVLDEINAYNHVAPFVCANETQSGGKQVRNLTGMLMVVEAYLRVARSARPQEYKALLQNRQSAGALSTIIQNAWEALSACAVPASLIPKAEAEFFASQIR